MLISAYQFRKLLKDLRSFEKGNTQVFVQYRGINVVGYGNMFAPNNCLKFVKRGRHAYHDSSVL